MATLRKEGWNFVQKMKPPKIWLSINKNENMRNRVLIAMGVIMIVCVTTLGFFAFPIGIPICGTVGLFYGIKSKDKSFIRWSLIALFIGIAFVFYTLLVIKSM